jgi:hypothetical protein
VKQTELYTGLDDTAKKEKVQNKIVLFCRYTTIAYNSVEIPTRCSFVIEFIIPKFFLKIQLRAHSALATAGYHMDIRTRGCKYSLEFLMMSGVPLETY